jgi:alkanesulfonate monooxygenase SsuD/methylene tetrahydromethanopterin reductase-like flavin-dependent oxidoreductase (luciferase family)
MAGRRRPDPRPRRRTDAILAALPGLLGGRPTALPNEPGQPVVTLEPAVPMPPVWIGGTSNAALQRAVTYGQGWLAALLSPDELACTRAGPSHP